MAKVKAKSKKPKKHASSKEKEVFWYLNTKGEKLWGFRHRYYDALGERKEVPRQGFATETIAIRELLQVKTDLNNGNVKKVDNSNLTVSEWLDQWFDENEKTWEVTTRLQREEVIRDQMKPLIGKDKLVDLDRPTYRKKYINVLMDDYEPGSVQLFHNLFRIAINAAVDAEIIPRNRFNKISIANDKKIDNFLTIKGLRDFLSAAKSMLNITNYTAALLLAYTGMRRGELQGLKWCDINLKNKTIRIERTRDRHGVRDPKTTTSFRTIYIDDMLVNQFKLYRKWCLETKFSKGKKLTDGDYIFISYQSGSEISDSVLVQNFDRVFAETGIRRITPHGFRHTHATILISKYVPVNVIAERLGNTPQMVLKVYAHTFKEMEIESVDVFSNALNS